MLAAAVQFPHNEASQIPPASRTHEAVRKITGLAVFAKQVLTFFA
jgi:hypothetical protein